MEKNILVINIGSSSKKYSLYKNGAVLCDAHFERDKEKFAVTYSKEDVKEISRNVFNDSLSAFYNFLKVKKHIDKESDISAIGIRLVAPGTYFTNDRVIDDEFLEKLSSVADEDRAHIEPIQKELARAQEIFGSVVVVAVSDSSFHKTMPNVAKNYALPKKLQEELDIHRFGYHGISLSGLVAKLSSRVWGLEKRAIICHLGSGASITAVLDGKSIDTSMGYSPLEGLVMSSRIGNIDAAAVLRLVEKSNVKDVQEMLYSESGLLAISGVSNDMRVLIDKDKEGHSGSHDAIDAFSYSVRKYIGMYVSVLGGVDVIVFSGTIGERSFILRERICRDLTWLNVHLDVDKNINAKSGDYIGSEGSLGVCVMHTDEDAEIMKKVESFL